MLLAIDSGNTNIVFAVYDGETRKGLWRAGNDPHRTADEYAVWLMQLMDPRRGRCRSCRCGHRSDRRAGVRCSTCAIFASAISASPLSSSAIPASNSVWR